MLRGILSTLLIAWAVFVFSQIASAVSEYGIYAGFVVMFWIIIGFAVAWLPMFFLKEMD